MSAVKKRKRSSLASCKIKLTDSPCEAKVTDENKESEVDLQKQRLLPNPENIAMEETIQMLEGRIERLKAEERDWNDYLKRLDDKIIDTERMMENGVVYVKEVAVIDELGLAYLYPMVSVEEVAKQVKESLQRCYLLVAEHEKMVHRLDQRAIKVATRYEHIFMTLQKKWFKVVCCSFVAAKKEAALNSPRRTIQNIMDLPTTVSEDSLLLKEPMAI